MNLDLIEKHVHITELPTGFEVMFGGQVCLTVMEADDGYCWKINQLFAKMTYGANIWEDVPYCFESAETLEEAIASGLTVLHDLGAFNGLVDLPEDTYATEELAEGLEELDERDGREDDEGYARTKNKDEAENARNAAKKIKYPKRKTPEQEKAEWDAWVKESVMADCRKEAAKHCDSLMETHYLAIGLYESFMEELDEGSAYQKKSGSGRLSGSLPKRKIDHDEMKLASDKARAKIEFDKKAEAAKKIGIKESEDLDEAALSGDAYWKAKEAEADAEKAKAERAKMGIKEPVKKGRGKPTLIDRDDLHTRAKENVTAGKRPTTGFDRNEKIHFVRHLKDHPDFAEHHVSAAGRPTGTTKAAGEEKQKEKKQAVSAFSMWAGLGKK